MNLSWYPHSCGQYAAFPDGVFPVAPFFSARTQLFQAQFPPFPARAQLFQAQFPPFPARVQLFQAQFPPFPARAQLFQAQPLSARLRESAERSTLSTRPQECARPAPSRFCAIQRPFSDIVIDNPYCASNPVIFCGKPRYRALPPVLPNAKTRPTHRRSSAPFPPLPSFRARDRA